MTDYKYRKADKKSPEKSYSPGFFINLFYFLFLFFFQIQTFA